jgi:hypothetical protein
MAGRYSGPPFFFGRLKREDLSCQSRKKDLANQQLVVTITVPCRSGLSSKSFV